MIVRLDCSMIEPNLNKSPLRLRKGGELPDNGLRPLPA